MKPELKNICLALGLGVLASSLSSCSLLGKGKYASQWEIESEVPASLNSGRATTPSPDALAGPQVKSNLDGWAPAVDGALDLPVSENGTIIDIPKPDGTGGELVQQSPPEMLNVPSSEDANDLPYTIGTPSGIETLLPAPPPAVTEEELQLAPAEVAAAEASAAAPLADIPLTPTEQVAGTAPSIPLLYGKLDLAPFLIPPAPLAAHAPLLPETGAQ